MTTAPQIPYTDRNVREDPSLTVWAYEYLKNYGGSFEPLVNAQELMANEGGLPAHLIRTVLNCMRHDTNVATKMPKPTPYVTSVPAFEERKKRSPFGYRGDEYISCGNTESHSWHSHKVNDEEFYCKGVPYAINRQSYSRLATVKTPYARSRTGKYWHYVAPGKDNADVRWYPKHHEEGFSESLFPELSVYLICRYPRVIRMPILLTEKPSDKDINQNGQFIKECPHCIAELKAQA